MRGAGEFRFGVNYVPTRGWWYSWNDFDPAEVARDLDSVAGVGADHVRIMVIWPYFQPNPACVSAAHLERLARLMDLAAERNLDVCASALVGWLSGFEFHPCFERGESPYTGERMLRAEEVYFRELAKVLAPRPNFLGFDLGNELNCCWQAPTPEGDAWSGRMLDLADELAPGRVHVNGVDHNPFFREATFSPAHLATRQRIVSLHTWCYFTGALERGGPLDAPAAGLAAAMTALAKAYAGDPAKPVWIQEFGATPEWMPAEVIPEFLEATVRRAARAGARWFTWWASHDLDPALEFDSLEYTLGLMTHGRRMKPQGERFRALAEEFRALSPADVERPRELPPPPAQPATFEATWEWLLAWLEGER